MTLQIAMTSSPKKIEWIEAFLASKSLSENSRSAYYYDLKQFLEQVQDKISQERLRLYEQFLGKLAPTAQKRKRSAVNQFLYYLYQEQNLGQFYRLEPGLPLSQKGAQLADEEMLLPERFYGQTAFKEGQILALLMLELGLLPTEIQTIKLQDLDLDFKLVKINRSGMVRILNLSDKLLAYLQDFIQKGQQTYLFERAGKTYSRQWFFQKTKAYLASLDLEAYSAQDLRRHYILRQKAAGKSLLEVSQDLGLKSPLSLEKYYRDGY